MASIRQYRKKIKSAKNIAKLTYAMQLVAASKMKKAQEQAEAGKEYSKGVTELSYLLTKSQDLARQPLLRRRIMDKSLIVLIAPEKGLCGSLITNLAKKVLSLTRQQKDCEFLTVGRKGAQIVKRLGGVTVAHFDLGLSSPKYEIVPPIARVVEETFTTGSVGKVTFVFSEFVNTLRQEPQERILLPLNLVSEERPDVSTSTSLGEFYLFEPSPEEIANSLLEMYLEVQIYQILLEAYASEQSARMIAMKNATDNAKDLIEQLSLEYNKVRQASITSEILDIGNAVGILTGV